MSSSPRTLGVLLFEGFELLDVFGPCEAYGIHDLRGVFRIAMVAAKPGPVASAQGPLAVAEFGFVDCPPLDLILVPGGIGTRREVYRSSPFRWRARACRTSRAGHLGMHGRGSARMRRIARRSSRDHQQALLRMGAKPGPASEMGKAGALGRGRQVRDVVRRVGRYRYGAGDHRAISQRGSRRQSRDRDGVRMAS